MPDHVEHPLGTDEANDGLVAGYFVRVGYSQEIVAMNLVGAKVSRDDSVVCRTSRGLELGQVLASAVLEPTSPHWRGKIVRHATDADHLLWRQLKELSHDAERACQEYLSAMGLSDVLLDAEPLLDGRTLYFHFLGEPSQELESYLQHLADVYQENVAASKFAKLLEHGCGPECGTKEKACGTSGGCAICSVAGKCSASKPNATARTP